MLALVIIGVLAVVASAQEAPALRDQKDRLSYALGMDLGKQLRKQSVGVDPALFGKGLADGLSGAKTLLSEDEARAVISAFQAELKEKQAQAAKAAAEENKKAGEAFLAENKKRPGVATLPSGLQYKILKAGGGKKPTEADTVVCHYRGTLIDGTEFDSSYQRNQPATFAVNGVIHGLSEALQLMPVGSKWQLFIPSSLAYAERAVGNRFGPNAVLIFEVELISIQNKS
jgi:FKBP-type peptidyl-prolyl cis-trans isomerase FklB